MKINVILNEMKYHNFHKDFRLNGRKFSSILELLEYAKIHTTVSVHSFLADWFNETPFVTVQTSGSTGTPKSIQLEKEHMINSAIATGTYFELPAKTTALLCLSVDYIAGKMMLVRALVLGWELDITTTDSHPLNGLQKTYDFSAMVPLQVHNSTKELDRVKKLIVGGGAVSMALQERVSNSNTKIYATYGMTETITHIAIKRLNNFSNVISNESEKSRDHYQTMPDVRISKDARGCLVIDAPKISNERIITNDLVELISETEFNWLGRYDTIINSGGIKLIPEQIERKLSEIIDTRFFVSSLEDEILGERLILVIESESTDVISNTTETQNIFGSMVTSEALRNLTSLHKFEIPKEIYFLNEFAETDTKKINRKKTLEKIKAL